MRPMFAGRKLNARALVFSVVPWMRAPPRISCTQYNSLAVYGRGVWRRVCKLVVDLVESRTQRGTPPHHRLFPPPLGHLFVRIRCLSSCGAVQDGENVCRRALNGTHSSLSFGKLSSIACCGALAGHDELRLRYIGCTHRAIFNTRALAIRQSIFPLMRCPLKLRL